MAPLIPVRLRDSLFVAASAFLALVLALRLHGLTTALPYYFAYDMDFVTSLDALFLHSQLLPDHLCHPGFGMNLILWQGTRWLHALGQLSALSLSDVEQSLNPLALMAEHAEAVRLFGPAAVFATAVLLSLALWRLLDLERWWVLAIFVLVGWQASSSFHAAMLRTECFAVLWWSAALWVAVEAGRARRRGWAVGGLLLTGLLLGVSFLTKVQGVFFLAAVPAWLALATLRHQRWDAAWFELLRRRSALVATGVTALLSIGFVGLTHAAQRAEVPKGILTWATSWGRTPLWWACAAVCGALVLAGAVAAVWPRARRTLLPVQVVGALLASGVCLSLLLHLVIYDELALGWRYLLLDFKFALLRHSDLVRVPTWTGAWATLSSVVKASPGPFVLHAVALLVLIATRWRRWSTTAWAALGIVIALIALALLQIAIATRVSSKDLVWQETLLNLGTLLALGMLWSDLVVASRRPRLVVACTLGLLVLLNVRAGQASAASVQRAGPYYWQEWVWLRGIGKYEGNQRRYKKLMGRRYPDAADRVLKDTAREHAFRLQLARATLPDLALDQRSLGVLATSQPALRSDLALQQIEGPRGWRGSVLIDVSDLLDTRGARRLRVTARADADVMLLVDDTAWSAATSRDVEPSPERLVLGDGPRGHELKGLWVTKSCTVQLAGSGPVLVAVRRR
ncbi:MAG: hypothetical protein ABIJ09_11510 [Pseudomonadota bacterium]